MLPDIADLLTQPLAYVCAWRDGELYIEPVAAACDPSTTIEGPLAL